MHTKTYPQAHVERNKHLSDLIKMVGEYKGPVISVPTYGHSNPMSDELKQAWQKVLLGCKAAFDGIPDAVAMLAPTLSDIIDHTSNHELKYQVFKVVGIHAPGDCKVDEFPQPWKDKLTKLLTIKDGSAFYVSGRTRSSDGTLYYSPQATATCHLLMVAGEKGDACKSKGCYNSIEEILDLMGLMVQFSQVTERGETMWDAEHIYPGCVP